MSTLLLYRWAMPAAADLDPELGIRTRKALLAMLVEPGWHSFSPHFPWPNLGAVRQAGEQRWLEGG